MPVRYFCDRDNKEIAEDDVYWTISIVPNSTRNYGMEEYTRKYPAGDREMLDIAQTMSMVCCDCAIHISKEMRMQPSAEHA